MMVFHHYAVVMMLGLLLVGAHGDNGNSNPSLERPFQQSFSSLKHSPCVSLFYRNGRKGCGTLDRESQTGKLVHYDGSSDLSSIQEPFVAIIKDPKLSKDTVKSLISSNDKGYLQGILVLNTTASMKSFNHYSPAPSDPQGKRTPSQLLNYGNAAYNWNTNGDGLMQKDLYGIPMAYVDDSDVSAYLFEGTESSDDGSINIMAEFNYYMGPKEMNSFDCLAWKDVGDGAWRPKCLPLGGNSIWAVAGGRGGAAASDNRRPVLLLSTAIDAASLFYGLVPGANTAASNILALLMAAKLLGTHVDDATLDGLSKEIVFGFFQGESFGFLGSRNFLRDVAYPGFECDADLTVPSVAKDDESDPACLYPMRPNLAFQDIIGQGVEIAGMLAVDQVGVLSVQKNLYIHEDQGEFGQFLSGVMQMSPSNGYTVSEMNPSADDDHFDEDDVTIPPTPLTSLLSLSGGAVGGAVLSGYGTYFNKNSYYWSHLDNAFVESIDFEAIATAATVLARTALAAAYDDGSLDYETSAQYAANIIPHLSPDNATMVELFDCLYIKQKCPLFSEYAKVEQANEKKRTGLDMGTVTGSSAVPPNYYVSVYDVNNGQPFVRVDQALYGAYNGDQYGKKKTDAFGLRPSFLEMSIRGMLNDFLGRGSAAIDEDSGLVSCKSLSDCSKVSYCDTGGSSQRSSKAVCTGGGYCVCPQSYYHVALDEAIQASPNNATGYFTPSSDDEEISAVYTEPYWSPLSGVRVYRGIDNHEGVVVLGVGFVAAAISILSTLWIKRRLKKEKLY